MRELLKAEFYKMLKNKYIFILLISVLLYDVMFFGLLYTDYFFDGNLDVTGAGVIIQQGFDDFLLIVLAIMTANIVSIDFQSMRVRNILAKGYSKMCVYLSKLIVCSLTMVLTFLLSRILLVFSATSMWGFDENKIFNFEGLGIFILMFILLTIAYASVFTFLAFSAKTTGKAVMCNILFLLFFPFILMLISAIFRMEIDISKFYMAPCLEKLATYTPLTRDIFVGFLVFGTYTILPTFFGMYLFNRNDVE